MSQEAVEKFRDAVNGNPALQETLRPYLTPYFNIFHVVRVGQENGFEFTAEEAVALKAQVGGDAEGRLSDFELEMVAGGASPSVDGPGSPPVPPAKG